MRGGGGAGGDGRHGTGRRGPPLPTKTVWYQAVDLEIYFFSFAPSLLFLLFLLPPALFVEPNQKCQSVRVSQKGSDYKITETDVGPAHTHPHTEAEARAAPRGRRAGIKQPPPTPAGPPLPASLPVYFLLVLQLGEQVFTQPCCCLSFPGFLQIGIESSCTLWKAHFKICQLCSIPALRAVGSID